jgi:hypothetical protein
VAVAHARTEGASEEVCEQANGSNASRAENNTKTSNAARIACCEVCLENLNQGLEDRRSGVEQNLRSRSETSCETSREDAVFSAKGPSDVG